MFAGVTGGGCFTSKRINHVQNKQRKNVVESLEQPKFSDLGFKERENLQEWICHNPEMFGEDLLIIQKEFDGFNEIRERLDLFVLYK